MLLFTAFTVHFPFFHPLFYNKILKNFMIESALSLYKNIRLFPPMCVSPTPSALITKIVCA